MLARLYLSYLGKLGYNANIILMPDKKYEPCKKRGNCGVLADFDATRTDKESIFV